MNKMSQSDGEARKRRKVMVVSGEHSIPLSPQFSALLFNLQLASVSLRSDFFIIKRDSWGSLILEKWSAPSRSLLLGH